ncbi:myelin-associated glycoprotein-like [Salvelinus namaycush]|uniref:Myelin-associated glycoprotein-like n=1 Tax=Salvelinus namaycush TaxID=8040 RepID=A0A8U0QDH1_SALNM|nr:myelin-associated glycoprotein-like [Salvelinus namaycush]
MPDRLDGLTGSCMQIPCSFDIPGQNKYTFNSAILTSGVWTKESPYFDVCPDRVIFNSSETVNRFQGTITGNMSQKNCTTVFFNVTTNYTNIFYFRIESQPFRATDIEKSVDIVVRDLPSSPILTVSGEVKEGTSVSLNCSAVAPCPEHPPELTWTLPTQFTTENQLQNSPVGTVCANQATAGEEPEEPAEDQPEEIHYGDIDFSKLRPKETPAAAQDRVQGQESEYAEVNVTGRGDQEPPLNNLDGLYAQVN